jgi:hypothetical protein
MFILLSPPPSILLSPGSDAKADDSNSRIGLFFMDLDDNSQGAMNVSFRAVTSWVPTDAEIGAAADTPTLRIEGR